MADDSGDKTEQPTQKRLLDARKKGDIAKGKELTSTATLLVWLVMGALCLRMACERIAALCEALFARISAGWREESFGHVAALLGWQSVELSLLLVAVLVIPVAAAVTSSNPSDTTMSSLVAVPRWRVRNAALRPPFDALSVDAFATATQPPAESWRATSL